MIAPPTIDKALDHPRPRYRLSVDGEDITLQVQDRLIDLTLTDNRGFEADQLELRLDDTDGRLALPARGAQIKLAIGWQHSGLVEKGLFTVDEIGHSGAPDSLTIRARSADLRTGLTTQRERSWHATTLGAIIKTIADENDLVATIPSALAGQAIEHIDQTNESAVNLLTRLAGQFDATATVKDGRLLFMPTAGGVSASGKPLPTITITRESGDRHQFLITDRDAYTGVKASYHDIDGAVKGEVIWGEEENAAEHNKAVKPASSKSSERTVDTPSLSHSADNVKTLRHVYANQKNAQQAARAEWRRIQRGMATFSITLARGRPELFPDLPTTVSGFNSSIDNTDWILTRVIHNLGDAGYTSRLELEIKATEIPD